MIYAQMYDLKTDGSIGEACGSDAVSIMDGRYGKSRWHDDAIRTVKNNRKFVAYRLMKGARFTDSRPISEIVTVR